MFLERFIFVELNNLSIFGILLYVRNMVNRSKKSIVSRIFLFLILDILGVFSLVNNIILKMFVIYWCGRNVMFGLM